MNNKGFAITSIIYGLMLLFVLVVSSFLSILVGRNRRMDELTNGIYQSVEYNETEVTSSSFVNDYYVTEARGLYYFQDSNCRAYLPKSVVLITGNLKDPSNDSVKNKLYYKVSGGDNIDEYKELTCID